MIQKEEYLYSAIYSTHYSQRAQTWITQLYLQITPCLPDGLPRYVVTHQLQVERGTGKVRRSKTDVLPLCHATKLQIQMNLSFDKSADASEYFHVRAARVRQSLANVN